MGDLMTVKEFATAAGVSRQTIYNKLDTDLTEYLTEIDSVKYIDKAALKLFKSKLDSQIDSQIDCKIDSDLTKILQGHISTLQNQIEELKADKQRLNAQNEELTATNKQLTADVNEWRNKYDLILERALTQKQLPGKEHDTQSGQLIEEAEQPAADTDGGHDLQALRAEHDKELQALRDEHTAQSEGLRAELRAEYDSKLQALRAEHEQERQTQSDELQALRDEVTTLKAERGIKGLFKRIFGKKSD